jgi:hypothetical protein
MKLLFFVLFLLSCINSEITTITVGFGSNLKGQLGLYQTRTPQPLSIEGKTFKFICGGLHHIAAVSSNNFN